MPEKITIFEPHFHDAQFGPTVNEAVDHGDDSTDSTTTESSSGGGFSKLKMLLAVAVVTVIGVAAYRRLSGDDGFEIEVEDLKTESPPTTE